MVEPYLTTQQLSERIGVPAHTIKSWKTRGCLIGPPAHKVGTATIYLISEVEAWEAETGRTQPEEASA